MFTYEADAAASSFFAEAPPPPKSKSIYGSIMEVEFNPPRNDDYDDVADWPFFEIGETFAVFYCEESPATVPDAPIFSTDIEPEASFLLNFTSCMTRLLLLFDSLCLIV